MKIRKTQFDRLSVEAERAFEMKVADYLAERFDDARSNAEARSHVAHVALTSSRGYGLSSEQEVATYAVSAWLLGKSFDVEFPAARKVLSADIPGALKARFLEEWTIQLFNELEVGQS